MARWSWFLSTPPGQAGAGGEARSEAGSRGARSWEEELRSEGGKLPLRRGSGRAWGSVARSHWIAPQLCPSCGHVRIQDSHAGSLPQVGSHRGFSSPRALPSCVSEIPKRPLQTRLFPHSTSPLPSHPHRTPTVSGGASGAHGALPLLHLHSAELHAASAGGA